jgi:hypothetical protein
VGVALARLNLEFSRGTIATLGALDRTARVNAALISD